jgi:8-oxo-dGTP pyrophosphatase MutT (NUDIX family)
MPEFLQGAGDLDHALKNLSKYYKYELKRELARHAYFAKRRVRRVRRERIPYLEMSELARLLLHRSWKTAVRIPEKDEPRHTLSFGKEDRPDIIGAVMVPLIKGAGRYIVTMDKEKQIKDETTGELIVERWCFPGGHREPEEDLGVTIKREFEEEVGLNLEEIMAPVKRTGSIKLRGNAMHLNQNGDVRTAVFVVSLTPEQVEKARPGVEQIRLDIVDDEIIDLYIECQPRMFVPNHINVWRLFNQYRAIHGMSRF